MGVCQLTFDLETTGTDTQQSRIVQIAVLVEKDGKETTYETLVNPTIAIEKGATEVHGITDEMVKDKPKFADIAEEVLGMFADIENIVTFNGNNFDLPLLITELDRCGLELDLSDKNLVDVLAIERKLNDNTLSSVYKRYTGEVLDDAHDALADVRATREVLEYQLSKLGKDTDLEAFTRDGKPRADIAGKFAWEGDVVVWTFGKNKGQDVKKDRNYADWFLRQDFPKESKEFLRKQTGWI